MDLHLYNMLSGRVDPFVPIDPARVRMYVCGPTVYASPHLGNARSAVVFDLLFRVLRVCFGARQVCYVRNITDIDDKIIAASHETGQSCEALTRTMTGVYHREMEVLGVLPPDHEPRASDSIADMIELIETLLARDCAYCAEGHVLFALGALQRAEGPVRYGILSRRDARALRAGARIEPASFKRDPQDFVLWKPSLPDQPGWESPWGRGRPGWHLECSAMARKFLGREFDIHGGGIDLVFPHHENEIIQTRCCDGGPVQARYWVHNGHLSLGGGKMSKSLGNIQLVCDLLEEGYKGLEIRAGLLHGHYRQPFELTERLLVQTRQALQRLWRPLEEGGIREAPAFEKVSGAAAEDILAPLMQDLNTPECLAGLHRAAGALRGGRATPEGLQALALGLEVMGIAPWSAAPAVPGESGGQEAQILSDDVVADQVAARDRARQAGDFAEADRLRDELARQGIMLEDGRDGTRWHRA